ncbi:MAG: gamma-glutamylcyclotransferase family protein [Pseudomonadota bacterium]|nr:gamma-glutamylcyclotransferase family protein [Pseudomonadota bacterium]HJO35313.1 gamma-glutamylcyclotransferase family protein [Gammaproteobacteria bacterium]
MKANDDRVAVFVYGALLCHPRTRAEGVIASVADHSVAFTVRGITRFEPSFASLDPAPGRRAWGALVHYTPAEWARIRRDELSYRVITVEAVTAEGGMVAAQAFSVLETHRARGCGPSARYAGLLRQGAQGLGLPPEVVAQYAALERGGSRLSSYALPWLKPLLMPLVRRVHARLRPRPATRTPAPGKSG